MVKVSSSQLPSCCISRPSSPCRQGQPVEQRRRTRRQSSGARSSRGLSCQGSAKAKMIADMIIVMRMMMMMRRRIDYLSKEVPHDLVLVAAFLICSSHVVRNVEDVPED